MNKNALKLVNESKGKITPSQPLLLPHRVKRFASIVQSYLLKNITTFSPCDIYNYLNIIYYLYQILVMDFKHKI